ncbi:hypothetical protein [Pseudomonas helleri]|mgnify:FL=1|uniref:hypothetical protein n=1 Tax=Pseudomonas helleri TaxID=1608996 RepID=UPI000FAAC6F3|nr:hypothetical protein [Pseudomonas helleri]
MTVNKVEKPSPLADFFCNASIEKKREVFNIVISKAIASQRSVVEKAEAIKKSRKSA